jgi:hypothetical protein
VIQGFFPGVAKRWVTDVVGESQGFGQIGVKPQSSCQGARGLRDLEGVGEPAAEVVSRRKPGETGENLRFARETPECARMQNASAVPGEWGAIQVRRLGMRPASEGTLRIDSNPWR